MSAPRLHRLPRPVSRPNARKVIKRLRDDVEILIDRCPKAATNDDVLTARSVAKMLWTTIEKIYS